MIDTLEKAREVADLARRMAEFARVESKFTLSTALSDIGAAADDPRITGAELPILDADLRDAYKSLYRPKEEGLADLFCWHPNAVTRAQLNADLVRVRTRLDELLLEDGT